MTGAVSTSMADYLSIEPTYTCTPGVYIIMIKEYEFHQRGPDIKRYQVTNTLYV